MIRMSSRGSVCSNLRGIGLGLVFAWISNGSLSAAEPLTVEQSLAVFQTDSHLVVELVASEPDVIDPVAAVFDKDGSLWVVQMGDYPHGPMPGEMPKSRIRRLFDRDGDGRFETATTFADQLLFATGLLPWKDGVIVTLAGEVAFLADRDGDGVADHRETWFTGFTQENSQLRANHPTLGLDGSVYIANGLRGGTIRSSFPGSTAGDVEVPITGRDFRFDPRTGDFEAVTGNGQFGLTFDDAGRRFVCTNRNPCIEIVFEERDLKGHASIAVPRLVYDVAASGEASRLFPVSKAWTTSTLHAGQFTAACGVLMYRSEGLGTEFVGNVFTCDPTGNLVHRERLSARGALLQGTPTPADREFLASPDTWFRPVNLTQGPDGALYVVDMYRAVIEHPQFMPEELKARPDLYDGTDRGRIWRVRQRSTNRVPATTFDTVSQQVAALQSPSAWARDTAFRLLLEANDPAAASELQRLTLAADQPEAARIAAAWLLKAQRGLDAATVRKLLDDEHARVRATAIELAESVRDDIPETDPVWLKLAADSEPRVRFLLARQLAQVPASSARLSLATALADQTAWENESTTSIAIDQDFSPLAIALAADPLTADLLKSLLHETGTGKPRRLSAAGESLLEQLAESVTAGDNTDFFEPIMVAVADRCACELNDSCRLSEGPSVIPAVLRGLARGAARRGRSWQALVKSLPEAPRQNLTEWLGNIYETQVAAAGSHPKATEAIWLQRLAEPDRAARILVPLAVGTAKTELRLAALDSLANCGAPDLAVTLLKTFPAETPAIRRAMLDTILARGEEHAALLDAIEARSLQPTEIDTTRAQRLLKHRDPQLRARAEKLLLSATADRQVVLEQYQPALEKSATADPLKGKQLFEKNCVTCHKIGTLGINVGPDIGDTRDKTPAYLLTAILDPNRAVDNNYFGYTAVTVQGKVYTGLIVAETTDSITIRQPEGKQETLLRDDLDELKSSGLSLMPVGLEKTLNVDQLAELISFLKNWRYLDGEVPARAGP